MAVEGDEILVDEGVSSQDVVVQAEIEDRADPVIAVKGDAVSIGSQDQEEVKEALVVGKALQKTVLKEPVLDEGKSFP